MFLRRNLSRLLLYNYSLRHSSTDLIVATTPTPPPISPLPHTAMSAATYKRQRTASAYEEKNVQDFIDGCVNFRSNVSFYTAAEGVAIAAEVAKDPTKVGNHAVLVLGLSSELSDAAAVSAAVPYAGGLPGLAAAIKVASDGKVYVASATEGGVRVLVGKIPTVASRHNCAVRPDIITKIIKGAVSEVPDKTGTLDVYVVGCASYELAVATAIARGSNRGFSAKAGRAESGYTNPGVPVRVVFSSPKDCAALAIHAASVQLCQRLVDAPTNLLDTTSYTEIAASIAAKLRAEKGIDVGISVIAGEELRERGYGGLYGTGKGAEFPAHLVTLSYKPKAGIAPLDKIAFVGKGVVYDTGGLAIKSRDGMCGMKMDMGGSAAVLTGFFALVQLGSPREVSCVLCLADNAVGPRAQRNDDIIRMKSGVTVEINNTDAEGRLVLSDGVYHASAELAYRPDVIVDMATLTGAQGVATGQHHAAIYANTEAAETRLVASGRASGDLCFPVVYCPELHNPEFASTVADYKNSVKNRANAQVSCAGQFIGNNLAKEYKGEWVHVDLAGPATSDQGTGFGVALLMQTFAGEFF